MNYIQDTSPTITYVNNTTLSTVIGTTIGSATSVSYTPTQNTDVSQLGLSPILSSPQTTITFTTPNSNTVDVMVAQFALYTNTIPDLVDKGILPPGIWEMNIYTKADANNDKDNIGLRFYLLGGTSGGTYTNLVANGSDIVFLYDHLSSQNLQLNLYIQNPIDISGYDKLLVVLTSRNRNSSSHTAEVYFQSSSTYSHIHTSFAMAGVNGSSGTSGSSGSSGTSGTSGSNAGITSYTNPSNNRVITSVSSSEINAEANLTFDGSILYVVGTVTETSTEKVKENIEEIKNPLDIVKKLRGVEYNKIGNSIKEIGLIAEEVDKVLPQVVIKDDEGNPASVSYSRITAILVEAIKIQNEQIENLTKRIDILEE